MSETNGVVKTNFAQAWKKQTMVVEFPSGLRAEMTKPQALSVMSESNDLPDMFLMAMIDAQAGKDPMQGLDAEKTREFIKSLDILAEQLAVRHFVNPRVVESPDYENGEISIEDVQAIDMADKQFLVNWAMNGGSPVDMLARFRDEQSQRVHAASNGGKLRD